MVRRQVLYKAAKKTYSLQNSNIEGNLKGRHQRRIIPHTLGGDEGGEGIME